MAQDDYYYEIQLTNKQLVFYFMAGATGLILSFLAGIMVGRGVDTSAGDVQAARPVREERIVPEEPKPAAPPSAEEFTYAQRLESDKPDVSLERAKTPAVTEPAAPAGKQTAKEPAAKEPLAKEPPAKGAAKPAGKAAAKEPPKPTAVTPKPEPAKVEAPKPEPAKAPEAAQAAQAPGGAFSIQVGAFKERAAADSLVGRLKAKGFPAYVVSPDGTEGLFNVRVGSYAERADAERVQARLRDEEKFKPFIVHQ